MCGVVAVVVEAVMQVLQVALVAAADLLAKHLP
jgi:hypothetical protein